MTNAAILEISFARFDPASMTMPSTASIIPKNAANSLGAEFTV